MPANAAEASILACAFLMRQIRADACVVVTVTGTSATRLWHIAPGTVILALTKNAIVARQLQIHKGIIPILYESKRVEVFEIIGFISFHQCTAYAFVIIISPNLIFLEPHKQTWYDENKARVDYAANYGLHCDILRYGSQYVTLTKSTPTISYCDSVSIWTVRTERKNKGFNYFNNY